MSILPVRVLGDPILRRIAAPVGAVTDDVRRLADNMFETMYAAKGIGLAAPQVGVGSRLFVTDVDGAKYVMVDPELVRADGPDEVSEEGCLSIPEMFGDVKRPSIVVMTAKDLEGEPFTLEATGLLGRCLLHELDHLNGRMFVDHLSFLKRRRALAEWAVLEPDFPGHVRILSARDPGEKNSDSDSENL